MNPAMQAAFTSIIKAAIGPEGPAMLTNTLQGMKAAFDAVAADQAKILEQQKHILIAQDNILDQLGRINKELRIPAAEGEANAGQTLQS